MLGAWPLEQDEVTGFKKRLQAYMVKAAREARVHTQWSHPNVPHEQALVRFLAAIITPSENNDFFRDFIEFHRDVAFYGALNSLAQLLLKITMPGVPDFYQGSELWDFRLVDPDNRGPVDFEKRVRLLAELRERKEKSSRLDLVRDLLNHWQDGRIKLFLSAAALNFRRGHEALFLDGAYEPLPATGANKESVFAFMRHSNGRWSLTAVPRLVTKLVSAGRFPVGKCVWQDSSLVVPDRAPADWLNVLTGESLQVRGTKQKRTLALGGIFNSFPVALLTGGAQP
jgi:(1->4)-alpha-D-glucan 1-alpha-D-glucosylmutase